MTDFPVPYGGQPGSRSRTKWTYAACTASASACGASGPATRGDVRILQQVEDERHVEAVLGHAADRRTPGEVVRPGAGRVTAQVEPLDDPAAEHPVGDVLPEDVRRVVAGQRAGEAGRDRRLEPHPVQQFEHLAVGEEATVGVREAAELLPGGADQQRDSCPAPARSPSSTVHGCSSPSTTGPSRSRPAVARMTAIRSSALGSGADCSIPPPWAAISSFSATPAKPARSGLTPSRSASCSVVRCATASGTSLGTPEMDAAAENRPRARGSVRSVITAPPPADCPAMVTRPGSPPKRPMVSRTQWSASSQSRTPRLAGASGSQPNPSKPSR